MFYDVGMHVPRALEAFHSFLLLSEKYSFHALVYNFSVQNLKSSEDDPPQKALLEGRAGRRDRGGGNALLSLSDIYT